MPKRVRRGDCIRGLVSGVKDILSFKFLKRKHSAAFCNLKLYATKFSSKY